MRKGSKNMKAVDCDQLPLEDLEAIPFSYSSVILNKEKFIQVLEEINTSEILTSIRSRIIALKDVISNRRSDKDGILNIDTNGDTVSLRRDVLVSELDQILGSRTPERAKYYLRRLSYLATNPI